MRLASALRPSVSALSSHQDSGGVRSRGHAATYTVAASHRAANDNHGRCCIYCGPCLGRGGGGSSINSRRSSAGGLALQPPALRQRRQRPRRRFTCASLEAGGDGSLVPLGLDFLTFLATTVLVIPLFKSVKASPVLGCGCHLSLQQGFKCEVSTATERVSCAR